MSDPRRLLDSSPNQRAASLLAAGMEMAPPPHAKEEVWKAISTSIGASVLAGGAASLVASDAAAATSVGGASVGGASVGGASVGGASVGSASVGSASVGGASVGGASVGGASVGGGFLGTGAAALLVGALVLGGGASYWAMRGTVNEEVRESPGVVEPTIPGASPISFAESPARTAEPVGPRASAPRDLEPRSAVKASAAQSSTYAAPTSKLESPAGVAAAQGPAVGADRKSRPASTAPDPSAIREESAALSRARVLLRQGNAGAALAELHEMSAKFPRPLLGQERQALQIEALAVSGQGALASTLAEGFLAAYPKSALCDRIRSFVRR